MGTLMTAGGDISAGFLNQYYGLADTNSTTVTQSAFTNLSTAYSISSAEVAAGSAYEMIIGGSGTWGSTQTTIAFAIALAGATISNVTIANTVFAASAAFRFNIRVIWVFASTGAGGTWFGNLHGVLTQNANNVLPGTAADNTVPVCDANIGASSVNTTSAMAASIQCKWGSAADAATLTNKSTLFRKVA